MPQPKVQAAICPTCGGIHYVAVTETAFDRKTCREFAKYMEEGYLIRNITLVQARTIDMCFDQTHLKRLQ